MSQTQNWPLSQQANKKKGTCSVCHAIRQLKDRDGTVHRHGPRLNPCPGSDLAPSSVVNSSGSATDSLSQTTQQQLVTPLSNNSDDAPNCSASSSMNFLPDWSVATQPCIKHIPKSVRPACSSHLAGLLRNVVSNRNNLEAWRSLFSWCSRVLPVAKRGGKRHNLTSVIRKRLTHFSDASQQVIDAVDKDTRNARQKDPAIYLSRAISSKLEDGNTRAAVRLICSDEAPVQPSQESLDQLRAKHPPVPPDRSPLPDPSSFPNLELDESDVLGAIRSFPAGSAGGPDGFRPQHLLDLVSNAESGPDLITALTAFVNMILGGSCHPEIVPILFGGRLIALSKKKGGIRPIAVGFTLRRLISKCASRFALSKITDVFSPNQVGVGVPGGCEAAIHATRRFIDSMPSNYVVAKLDFSNAFNCLRRDSMLLSVKDKIPELYKYCHLAYSQSSLLQFGSFTVLSEEGTQQGDPLGPLLFCLTVHSLLSSLSSQLNIGYLDDFTLGGPDDVVSRDVDIVIEEGAKLGLHLNISKCELICATNSTHISDTLKSFVQVQPQCASLLGAPLFVGHELDTALSNLYGSLSAAIDKLCLVSSHDALLLLRASFSAPRLSHILRCSPCHDNPMLVSIDSLLMKGICRITNIHLSDVQWLQASLPVRDGGLGVRRVVSLAIPAYLASAAATRQLQDLLLADNHATMSDPYDSEFISYWSARFVASPPTVPICHKQAAWDSPGIQSDKSMVWDAAVDTYDVARLTAVSAPHSGDWLHARPIAACGLRLDDEAVRVAVGLRLGANLCHPHTCHCGALVEARGSHGLSCKLAFGRMARHQFLNDLVWRALVRAGIPSVKEPSGLVRTDGKRPDGVTLIPWQNGKSLAWDVTVVDTLAASYIASASLSPGGAAEQAAEHKKEKYATLPDCYDFQPLAFETLGPNNSSGIDFFLQLGRRLETVTGDSRERAFLFQRLSLAVQRFNAVAFRGSFKEPDELEL